MMNEQVIFLVLNLYTIRRVTALEWDESLKKNRDSSPTD
jgi:hypothetical protein